MKIQDWLPLLSSRKEIIISHIAKFYPPNPQSSKDMFVVMDQTGKTFNRKPRKTDKEKILNGEIFLIYVPDDTSKIYEEENAENLLDYMTELLSQQQNEIFTHTCISEKADTFVQKTKIFERDFPDEYREYLNIDEALQSMVDFNNFSTIPEIYDNMFKTAQKSKTIEEYFKISFSENK